LLSQRAPCASRKALNFFYRTVHGSAVGQPSLADHFDVHHHYDGAIADLVMLKVLISA